MPAPCLNRTAATSGQIVQRTFVFRLTAQKRSVSCCRQILLVQVLDTSIHIPERPFMRVCRVFLTACVVAIACVAAVAGVARAGDHSSERCAPIETREPNATD